MPNWCSNVLTIKCSDEQILDEIMWAAEAGKLLQHLRPSPTPQYNYEWSIANWGTKWDVECYTVELDSDKELITLKFDSAWSSPIEAVMYAEETLGITCELLFYESGMGLLGEYTDYETSYHTLPESRKQVRKALDTIPEHLIYAFNLQEDFNLQFEEQTE
jgi:hypothetical protein